LREGEQNQAVDASRGKFQQTDVRRVVLFLLLFLAACGGSPRDRGRPFDEKANRECKAGLTALGIRFRALPDRKFSGGCSAIGTVQLLDIGMPTTNLGAMTCPLAARFTDWAQNALQPAARAWLDAPVVKVESFGTYACRPINNVEGGRLSEHGRSNAVDVSAFILGNGRRITVLNDWNGPDQNARNFLRAVEKAACRRFDVVLGPDANALHRNHLHFDMGGSRACR
jgi:hypothetical protein